MVCLFSQLPLDIFVSGSQTPVWERIFVVVPLMGGFSNPETMEPVDNFSFDESQFLCYMRFQEFGDALFIS